MVVVKSLTVKPWSNACQNIGIVYDLFLSSVVTFLKISVEDMVKRMDHCSGNVREAGGGNA